MEVFKNNFIKPIYPWLVMFFGMVCLIFGYFVVEDNKFSGLFVSIGTSVLAGGVLTTILKTVQFLGIFKEEINSVIFETKFLKNRVDLGDFWEKVTKEFIKGKFPTIHNKMIRDVKEQYLPVSSVQYYENYTTVIKVELIDPSLNIVKVNHKLTFNLVMDENHKNFTLPYRSAVTCEDKCPFSKCSIKSVKLNGSFAKFTPKEYYSNGELKSEFDIKLNNSNKGYKVEIEIEKVYSLKNDNIIGYKSSYILNKLKMQLFLKGVNATFVGNGNLKPFKESHTNDDFIEREYEDLLYKGQGFYVLLNR